MPTASSLHVRHTRPIGPDPSGSRRTGGSPLVLGFDPGLRCTGYAAIQVSGGRPRIREAGVLVTNARGDLAARLLQLHRDIEGLFHELRPDLVMLEDLFVHRQFPRTAIVLGHARGLVYLAAAASRVSVVALAPSAVKQAITGSGRASKAQVQASVRSLLGLRRVADPHAADALALAYAGLSRIGSIQS